MISEIGFSGRDGLPLRQQIGLLVLIFEEARFRGVLFAEDHAANDAKARTAPCVEELVDLRPAGRRRS